MGTATRSKVYIPKRGDLVWLDFSPQSGHEQAGRRPALVLTGYQYNKRTGRAVFCPITSRIKGYPFEIEFTSASITGAVLADQFKNLDYRSRTISYIRSVRPEIVEEVAYVARDLLLPE